jgi:uncharacterized protein YggU (UPF0235/DUF167 family)
MKIHVRVKPNSSEQKIEDFGDRRYLVYVTSPAEDNEANIEMLKMIGKHLGIPSTKLRIIAGASSKDKVIESVY